MGAFDYHDPGTDQAYCDPLSDPPVPTRRCGWCHDPFDVRPEERDWAFVLCDVCRDDLLAQESVVQLEGRR